MSYAFRTKSSSPTLCAVSDLYGHVRNVSPFKRGDEQTATFRDLDEPEPPPPLEPDPIAVRLRLRQLITDAIARYEASGRLTAPQLRTIRALWLDDLPLREFARAEGVTGEAVRARVEGSHGYGGLKTKAPEFYRWWAFKHRARRQKGGCRVARRSAGFNTQPTQRAA